VAIAILNPVSVGVDGAGSLYVVSGITNNLFQVVKETPGPSGTYTASTVYTTVGEVMSVAVDGNGVVYADMVGSNTVISLTPSNSGYKKSVLLTVPSPYIPGPLAVDAAGNLYVVETETGQTPPSPVVKLTPASAGAYTQSVVNGSWTGVSGIAVDAGGSVYVTTGNNETVVKATPSGTSYTFATLAENESLPTGIAVDPAGDLIVTQLSLSTMQDILYSEPPAVFTFPATAVGSTSSTVDHQSVFNDGNAPLVFVPPASGDNPSLSTGFGYDPASNDPTNCPIVPASSTAASSLAPGALCTFELVAQPVAPVTFGGYLTLSDNNVGIANSQQLVPLVGTGVTTITFTVPTHTYGDPPFTVSASSNSPGAIIYTVVSGPATISGSTVMLTGAGTVTLLANQAASGAYSAGSATATFTVALAAQKITFAYPSSPVNPGAAAIMLSATASSGLPVTFSVLSGPGTVNGNSLTPTGTGTIVVAANQAGDANFSVAPQVTHTIIVIGRAVAISLTGTPSPVFLNNPVTLTATLAATGGTPTGTVTFLDSGNPIGSATLAGTTAVLSISILAVGTHTITAVYPGDSNFSSQASPAVVIVVQDFTLSIANPSLTIQHGGTAVYTLVITSIGGSGMAASINLSVAGAPDHSGVTFEPASVASGSGTTTAKLMIATPDYPVGPWEEAGMSIIAIGLMSFGGLLFPFTRQKRKLRHMSRLLSVALLTVAAFSVVALSGCGSGWGTQHYHLTITAASGQLSHTAAASLTSQ
jgi:hypothetical protein